MYSGQFYGNQAYNSNFNDKMTMRPNYSIDKVIERVHIIASDINELTHIAENNAQQVATKGEDSINKFNVHFSNTSMNVAKMVEISRERFYGIPINVFYAGLICALVVIILGIIYLLMFGTHRVLRRRNNYRNVPPKTI